MINQIISASNLIPIISIVVFLVAAITLFTRTGSGHLLRVRMWRTLSGKTDVEDPVIQQYISETTSLQAYQYYSRINAGTLEDARRLIEFSKQRNLPSQLIRRAGEYFDITTCKINEKKFPGKFARFVIAILFLLFAFLVATSLVFIFAPGPVYKMRESGTRFILTENSALPMPDFWLSRPGLTTKDCAAPPDINHPPFTNIEAKAICKALQNPEETKDLQQDLATQRRLLGSIILFSLYVIGTLLIDARKVIAARALRSRLEAAEAPSLP